jgi:hypothetical protein
MLLRLPGDVLEQEAFGQLREQFDAYVQFLSCGAQAFIKAEPGCNAEIG